MPRFSLPDVLRPWIDPDVLGLTALPLPTVLEAPSGRCSVCGASLLGHELASGVVNACHRPPGIDALISLGDYSGPAGQAARLIKGTCWTDGAWWWGCALGQQLLNPAHGTGRARIGAASGEDATSMIPPGVVLVPVPGDRLRTLLRGIDHATALTRAVSAACGWPWRSLLVRQDRTRQASRRARKRREIQGRFSMQSNRDPIPERVLLVDDICTTGATAADCARAVRLAGAEWVSLGVLARSHR